MKKGLCILAAFAALAFVVGAADADCRRVVNHVAVVETPVIVTPIAVATVFVPTYAVGYAPSYAPAAPAPQQSNALEQLLLRMDARLSAIERQGGGPGPVNPPLAAPQPKQTGAGLAFGNRCATCHDKAVAAGKGGGLAFSDGPKLTMSDADIANAVIAITVGKMPKGGKLDDNEVLDLMTTMKAGIGQTVQLK